MDLRARSPLKASPHAVDKDAAPPALLSRPPGLDPKGAKAEYVGKRVEAAKSARHRAAVNIPRSDHSSHTVGHTASPHCQLHALWGVRYAATVEVCFLAPSHRHFGSNEFYSIRN